MSDDTPACCTPGRPVAGFDGGLSPPPGIREADPAVRRVRLDGGWFSMGSVGSQSYPDDGEGPVRRVRVSGFALDPYCVSNARFRAFVDEVGHVTDAERYGALFVFGGLYCRRYRVSARMPNTPESSTGNIGFRCAGPA